jgi:glycosyltransferase involved in cell wall biosynthesis
LSKASKIEPSIEPKSYVVHNGVELELFKSTTRYRHRRPYLLSYGRLTSSKGFDLLLSAFAQASKRYFDVDLIIAGEGEESEHLKELARHAGLGDRVHFFGRAGSKQIIELLNGCLFLVVPSRSESFGISALEGMAAGKAVLATNVGGLPELLDTSVNKLVNPSVDDLTAGIGEWLASLERVSIQGPQNRLAAAEYDWNRTVDGYLNAYRAFGEKAA